MNYRADTRAIIIHATHAACGGNVFGTLDEARAHLKAKVRADLAAHTEAVMLALTTALKCREKQLPVEPLNAAQAEAIFTHSPEPQPEVAAAVQERAAGADKDATLDAIPAAQDRRPGKRSAG